MGNITILVLTALLRSCEYMNRHEVIVGSIGLTSALANVPFKPTLGDFYEYDLNKINMRLVFHLQHPDTPQRIGCVLLGTNFIVIFNFWTDHDV